jgi:RNA polymerase-binding transcription factor DksA
MAKKPPAKKPAPKPVKKAPSKTPAPAKKQVAKVTKAVVSKPKTQVKQAPSKKVSKPVSKPAPVKPAASKAKAVTKVNSAAKTTTAPTAKSAAVKKAPPAKSKTYPTTTDRVLAQQFVKKPAANKNNLTPFLLRQRQRLLDLKDTLLDSMSGVARGNLHAGSETSAFGMHQADAGSDAYDRDFALSMLSKEQGSLYEIDEALKRIEDGTYGMCEICEKPIRHDRLEALPFTRYTVECQAELEKRQHHHSVRPHINSLFGLTEEEAESEEEETLEP